ncbi:hypothetical protein [Robiginitalea biformata]|uniref:Uncharacterized protein n=1 Tax=Robiginitalea biformata (strain ATCC BAA-864 / DSM 15991 / KCTC 12146 / HTCC2501) TaxID=313596 RepID=A4CPN2_ROBBH|nr:hypothetical protein [Robiginitalea biformata]EAR14353.1 hypothetical protein RB2501_02975 [Robiginitalea biformata HTCC2501]
MAPVDFERKIKEKLQEQEIQPTPGAWERLSGRLDVPRGAGRRKRWLPWMYAAAACLLIVLGVRMLSGPGSAGGIDPMGPYPASGDLPVVAAPDTRAEDRQHSQPPGEQPPADALAGEASPEKRREATESAAGRQPSADPTRAAQLPLNDDPGPDIANNGEAPATGVDTSGLALQINRQLDAILTEVAQREQEGGAVVTDAEIDSLLREAQERIAASAYRMPRDSVDARSLLSAAESELDQTFREELFEKLKDGFRKVRTAVADRNN